MSSSFKNNSDPDVKIELPEKCEQLQIKIKKGFNPPDRGWAWVVAIASFFAAVIGDGVIFSYGVITPEFIKHFGVSRSTIGWMGSLLISITLCVGMLASYLCQKFSYRTVAVAGSVLSAVGFALPYFCPQVWLIFLSASILSGIGFGFVYFPSIVIVNVWFEKKRSLALGISICGSGLGTFLMSPLLQYLIDTFEWQLTMLITGAILLLMVPCCMTYKNRICEEEKEEEMEEKPLENKDQNILEENDERGKPKDLEMNTNELVNNSDNIKASYVELMKNSIFWLFLISNVLTSIGFDVPYIFTKDRTILQGYTEDRSSYLISAIGIGNCFGKILFGYLSTLKCVNRFHVYNISLIVSGLILVISWFIHNYYVMVIYNIAFGIMTGPYMVLLSIVLVDIFGLTNLDKTLSITLVFQGLAVFVGPPTCGYIFDLTHSYNITFAVCGTFIAVSGLIMYLSYISKDFRQKKFNLISK